MTTTMLETMTEKKRRSSTPRSLASRVFWDVVFEEEGTMRVLMLREEVSSSL